MRKHRPARRRTRRRPVPRAPEGTEHVEILDVTGVVAGGDGMARRGDGRVVFVPRSSPGERVEISYIESHAQWLRGRIVRIVTPGPDRREPPCPYYARCGGCQLQHLHYDAQLRAKAAIVADSLKRLGHLGVGELEASPSPREFGYRNRVSFVLRRTHADVVAGYHAVDSPDEIVDVERCLLAESSIQEVWTALRAAWGPGASRLPIGNDLRLTLRAASDGRVGLAIEGGRGSGETTRALLETAGLAAIWSLDEKARVTWHAGEETLSEHWGRHHIPLSGTAFLQVNREAAEHLEKYVREQCGGVAGRRVVDAYCGFGLRALGLAEDGATVVGIDTDRHAIAAAQGAARVLDVGTSGIPGDQDLPASGKARFLVAPVERVLAGELPADVVILNPPRRGIARAVVHALLRTPPERIVYVSCNPATLARDLGSFGSHFALASCRAFDLFPQTAHVETVATLTRRNPV